MYSIVAIVHPKTGWSYMNNYAIVLILNVANYHEILEQVIMT